MQLPVASSQSSVDLTGNWQLAADNW